MRLTLAVLVVAVSLVVGCSQQPVKSKAQTERDQLVVQSKKWRDSFKACLQQAKKTAGSKEIGETKIIHSESDPHYTQKLNDSTYATPEEAKAAFQFSIARRPCLGKHIENLSRVDTQLGLLRSEAAAASDQDLIDLATGEINWGELNRREQVRAKITRKKVQEITQRIDSRLRQQHQAETQTLEQRERIANQRLQGWYNTQLLINSKQPQSATTIKCLMKNNLITCRSL